MDPDVRGKRKYSCKIYVRGVLGGGGFNPLT